MRQDYFFNIKNISTLKLTVFITNIYASHLRILIRPTILYLKALFLYIIEIVIKILSN